MRIEEQRGEKRQVTWKKLERAAGERLGDDIAMRSPRTEGLAGDAADASHAHITYGAPNCPGIVVLQAGILIS